MTADEVRALLVKALVELLQSRSVDALSPPHLSMSFTLAQRDKRDLRDIRDADGLVIHPLTSSPPQHLSGSARPLNTPLCRNTETHSARVLLNT